jgi:predicted transcriptional regulator YdeE
LNYDIVERNEVNIIGLSVRTVNKDGKSMGDIAELTKRFFSEDVMSKIPEKISGDIYYVYTDYESDHHSPYTAIVGCMVSSLANMPDGMTGKKIPAGKFAKYSAAGKIPEIVVEIWNSIYAEGNYERSYMADFDLYKSTSFDPNNMNIEVYVSIK